MTRTGNTYEKWLWGDNTINIQGRTMVHVHSTASHCKHFSWTSPGPVAFENGQTLIFSDKPEKTGAMHTLLIGECLTGAKSVR